MFKYSAYSLHYSEINQLSSRIQIYGRVRTNCVFVQIFKHIFITCTC
jgi:hypothetical protein